MESPFLRVHSLLQLPIRPFLQLQIQRQKVLAFLHHLHSLLRHCFVPFHYLSLFPSHGLQVHLAPLAPGNCTIQQWVGQFLPQLWEYLHLFPFPSDVLWVVQHLVYWVDAQVQTLKQLRPY